MTTTSDAAQRASSLLAETGAWEGVLEQLRAEGFSKTDSIRATVERLGVSLSEAKAIVHDSETWSDRRAADDDFHDDVEEAVSR